MEKIFEGAISCKALLEAGSRDCKKLYIDKKKNTKDTRYLAKIAKSRGCEVVFCSRDEINALATGKTDSSTYPRTCSRFSLLHRRRRRSI